VALWCLVLLSFFRGFSCCSRFGLSSGFREELLKIFEKVGCGIEEMCNLRVDVLDWLRLALVGLKDLKELLIDLWSILEPVLLIELVQIFDRGIVRI
jgi:hypothetical protein